MVATCVLYPIKVGRLVMDNSSCIPYNSWGEVLLGSWWRFSKVALRSAMPTKASQEVAEKDSDRVVVTNRGEIKPQLLAIVK